MVTPYQYVCIRSKLSGHCLDVSGQSSAPGTKVICWEKNGQKNQQWYFDAASSTIKSVLNEFCLDYNPGINSLVINPFNPSSEWQKWEIAQNTIRNKSNPSQVADVLQGNTQLGAQVGLSQFHGNSNQLWDFDVAGGSAPGGAAYVAQGGVLQAPPGSMSLPQMQWQKKEFMIKSIMDSKVVDIKGNSPAPGTPICMYNINKQKNQLWYLDQSGFIRSSLNDFVFHGDEMGHSLKMVPFSSNPKHQWRVEGDKIMNGVGQCLDIRGGKCSNGSELCAYTFKNKENQRWIIQYL